MATSPSLSYSVTQNCKVHDGSVTQNGIISWSVAGQAESAFSPTKANYEANTSGWSNRYYWSGDSGTKTFGSSSGTVTISVSVTVYTKTIIASDSYYYAWYATESEASSYCNSVSGSAQYLLSYQAGANNSGTQGYQVWRRDLSISTSSSTQTLTGSVNTSNYIDRTYTTPTVTNIALNGWPGGTYQLNINQQVTGFTFSFTVNNPGGVNFTPKYTIKNSTPSVLSYTSSTSTDSYGRFCVIINVKGLSAGTSGITITSDNGPYSYIDFEVKSAAQVTGIDLFVESIRIPMSGSTFGECFLSIDNPYEENFNPIATASSSVTSVASVGSVNNKNRFDITPKSPGTSTITATYGNYTDSETITVYGVSSTGKDYNSIYCEFSYIQSGDTLKVTAGSITTTVTATSSSKTVWVTGLSSSTSYSVTASVNGTQVWSGTITTDTPPPSVNKITISGDESYTLNIGETIEKIEYSVSISNDNGSYTPSIEITTDPTGIVEYSNLNKSRKSGTFDITAIKPGNTTLTIKAGGSKTDSITITVLDPKTMYIGVDNISRKVKKAYIGIDNIPRKVKKIYIGVNGIAKLCYRTYD